MKVINFAEQNSVINHFMADLRDKSYQKNRLTFRHNVERIGEMMAYELSKTLDYKPKTVTTPLGTIDIPLMKQEDMIIATVLRAGLPFHQGFLNVFDRADNAFVSAFRMYLNREHTEVGVHTEYIAAPSVKGKTLLIVDPMLATGGSLAAAIEALLQSGKPKKIHVCCVIAAPEGIEVVKECLPDDATIWCAAIDEGMNEHKYIVPGFGDCGDLCYGEKLQSFRKTVDKDTKKKGLL
jgi:uracil phosphoribosyltransferase